MSAVIRQMVLRKRAAAAQAAANAAAYADVVARAKGEPGIVWRGAWQAEREYKTGNAVSRKGSSYVALVDAPKPPPSADWDVLAEKGKDGKAAKEGKTTIYSSGGGGSDLYTIPQYDPTINPLAVALNQNGVWREIPWLDFLALIGSAPTVLPNQIVVHGVAITVGAAPVFVTPSLVPNQVMVNGQGVTVNGQPVTVGGAVTMPVVSNG